MISIAMEPGKFCESRNPICCDRKQGILVALQTCHMLCPQELDIPHLVEAREEPWRSSAGLHDQSTWNMSIKIYTGTE